MGLFSKTPKPKFNLIDYLFEHEWEVGLAVGVILVLVLLLCRCFSAGTKVPRAFSLDELIEPEIDSDSDDDEDDDEEVVITPRRSARLRNKRLSLTI